MQQRCQMQQMAARDVTLIYQKANNADASKV